MTFASTLTPPMSLALVIILAVATLVLLALERGGAPVLTPQVKLKGDINRESGWVAQFGQGACVIVAALLVWRLDLRTFRWGLSPGVMLLAGTFGTALICGFIKRLCGRVRPRREHAGKFLGPTWKHANWRESFPSLHSASAVAFALILSRLYPQAAAIFWTLAILCASLRYILDAHWPSDVLAGIGMGYVLSHYAWVFWTAPT